MAQQLIQPVLKRLIRRPVEPGGSPVLFAHLLKIRHRVEQLPAPVRSHFINLLDPIIEIRLPVPGHLLQLFADPRRVEQRLALGQPAADGRVILPIQLPQLLKQQPQQYQSLRQTQRAFLHNVDAQSPNFPETGLRCRVRLVYPLVLPLQGLLNEVDPLRQIP